MFDAGPGRVLRRYRNAAKSAEPEARIMVHARAHGVVVPEVFDASGPDLVMERVDGPTMANALLRRPWRLGAYARQLADVHRVVHAVPGPDWLPTPFGEGGALLHLDLHPENVLIVDGAPVVIDWPNAVTGPPEADVADTWLVLASARASVGKVLAVLISPAQARFAKRFRAAAGLDLDAVLPAVGERRNRDRNMSAAERARHRPPRRSLTTSRPARCPRRSRPWPGPRSHGRRAP